MVGRDLPEPKHWDSVTPAASLSLVWGAGGCRVRSGAHESLLEPSWLMWLDAGCAHHGEGLAGSDFLTIFAPAIGLPVTGTPTMHLTPLQAPEHDGLLTLAAATLRSDALIVASLSPWLQAFSAALRSSPARLSPAFLRKARRQLDAGYRGGLALGGLARTAGCSPSHLSRSFHAETGIPISQYRKQLRLVDATLSLARGRPVGEAALEAGFADAAHLSRVFRAQYGLSPSRWRRLVSEAALEM
jgi:AraC-like DNA-binding protein